MRLSEFDYHLPDDLIAQQPAGDRTGSRLLVVSPSPAAGRLDDRRFTELPALLTPGDLLVFNDTRVIKARLFGRKASGGAIEVFIERVIDEHRALAMIRASHAPKVGAAIHFDEQTSATVEVARKPGGTLAQLVFDAPVFAVLERLGRLPLPPYITHDADATDDTRYQTVYAREPGAVAAPTAGLHFDDALLDRIRAAGIDTAALTLHVGAGTFLPVREDDLSRHQMHAERFTISRATADAIAATRRRGGRVIAVGTTTMRALESAAARSDDLAMTGETDLFITPGYRFRVIDRLITNFHLPKSTLLILVSAFAGREAIRQAYAHAVDQRYRFFSYGDAMLLSRADLAPALQADPLADRPNDQQAPMQSVAPPEPPAAAPGASRPRGPTGPHQDA
jgi:S-adenosylmethionine:tRNA ribosyltransferase-isomerase